MTTSDRIGRRALLRAGLGLAATGLAAPALAQAAAMENSTVMESDPSQSIRHNVSAFVTRSWQDHFATLAGGAILCDLSSFSLHYWSEDGATYRLYPTSIPISDELTQRGMTSVVEKVTAPTWRPTPSMRERYPDWPEVVQGGDPLNPLGPYALYLGWQYYRIHGTHDTRKIGRRSSNGCIGLYNEHITELFALAQVGTQVQLI
jgi:L,D-transpeptidase ErfK/SrfK